MMMTHIHPHSYIHGWSDILLHMVGAHHTVGGFVMATAGYSYYTGDYCHIWIFSYYLYPDLCKL